MIILFTDLDGSLLDRSGYSAAPAQRALRKIRDLCIPLVFCSSKTRAEIEYWRARLGNRHPFIVENGGALFIPEGYFPCRFNSPAIRDKYNVFEFGIPYRDLVLTLREASIDSGCRTQGFHDMSPEEINRAYGLPLEQARLAKIREYDEPFEILDPNPDKLLAAIGRRGRRWTCGGRLYHITGDGNKAHGVSLLSYYYHWNFSNIITVGLGDGMNDLDFLRLVDIPVIIRSKAARKLKSALPRARMTALSGPAGWNQAILDVIDEHMAGAEMVSKQKAG
jgi:mannosyl-3-phosphoglycerate phosphatase family protein